MNKSYLFTQYNQIKTDRSLDPKRVNRALGVAQMTTPRPYITTKNSCTCPDGQKHVCKHMIALRMQEPKKAPISTVVFEPTIDPLKIIEGEWQATITRTDGSKETVYRRSMPATYDERMRAAGLVYTGRNARLNQYVWKRRS